MIRPDDLIEIGSFYKPHGIKGEIAAGLDYDIPIDDLRCIITEVDGIFVPFFIQSWRGRSTDRFLIKLEGIDNETEAQALAKKSFFGVADEIDIDDDDPADGMFLYDMIGFTILDTANNTVGTIEDIDDSTENILLNVVDPDGCKLLVPFAEEWIEEFSPDSKTLTMSLPEGIIDLNK